jgi:Fe2+ or Zn2+ uptake regulation protein
MAEGARHYSNDLKVRNVLGKPLVPDSLWPVTEDPLSAAVGAALHERGQRVTPQRLAIARALRDLGGHSTAEMLFWEASRRIPGVSLPTVYATLELLEQLGMVRKVATDGGTVVYDPRTDPHHHAVCRVCNAIVDVDAPLERGAGVIDAAESAGFAVDEAQFVIRGVCGDCAAAAG